MLSSENKTKWLNLNITFISPADVRVRPNPGSIQHYDPMRDQQQNQGTPYSQRNSGAVVYDSSTGRGRYQNRTYRVPDLCSWN